MMYFSFSALSLAAKSSFPPAVRLDEAEDSAEEVDFEFDAVVADEFDESAGFLPKRLLIAFMVLTAVGL